MKPEDRWPPDIGAGWPPYPGNGWLCGVMLRCMGAAEDGAVRVEGGAE